MSPSKENARKALEEAQKLPAPVGCVAAKAYVIEFLEAVVGRLPTQAALDADKARRQAPKNRPQRTGGK